MAAAIGQLDEVHAKSLRAGDQAIPSQYSPVGVVCNVQVMPSGEVITAVADPDHEVAAKRPRAGDQASAVQRALAVVVWGVHVTASGEVITAVVELEVEIAAKR